MLELSLQEFQRIEVFTNSVLGVPFSILGGAFFGGGGGGAHFLTRFGGFGGCSRLKRSVFCVLGGFRCDRHLGRGSKKSFLVHFCGWRLGTLLLFGVLAKTTMFIGFWGAHRFWVKSASGTTIFIVFCLASGEI